MTRTWTTVRLVTLALTVGSAVCFGSTTVRAQTPPQACALDSLYLLSPAADDLSVSLSTEPWGAVIRWLAPPPETASCAVLVDTAGVGTTIELSGTYRDHVDRALTFTTTNGGTVGDPVHPGPLFTWVNMNQERTGQVIGALNLGNNGGVFSLQADDTWRQITDGLPMTFSRVDVLALAATPARPGRLLAYLQDDLARGLWLRDGPGESWRRLAPDIFPDGSPLDQAITALAIAPDDAATLVVGTIDRGIFVSHDTGQTFTQHQDDLAGEGADWALQRVTLLSWREPGRLVAGIDNLGVFFSTDGDTYQQAINFTVPRDFPSSIARVPPELESFHDTGDAGILLAGVARFGLYRSLDGGNVWVKIWRDQDPEHPVPVDGSAVVTDPDDPDEIWLGTHSQGLWHTTDGGVSWDPAVVTGVPDSGTLAIRSLAVDAAAGRYVAVTDGGTLLTCPVGTTDWSRDLPGPGIADLVTVVAGSGDDRLWLATQGGGIYRPGTPLPLSETIVNSQTEEAYRHLDLGLSIAFAPGTISIPDSSSERRFRMVAQDFQGYAVWRNLVGAPQDSMEVIALYDKNNPETCIEGYCGDTSFFIQPGCFHEKRAACFSFSSEGDTVTFFDRDIYDGFVYHYAVTTFDYGNTALVNPQSLTAELIFSPRYTGDPLSPFAGEGNFVTLRAFRNDLVDDLYDEIYVVPNPLRRSSRAMSTTAASGEEVQFKNLPAGSRVQVFTVDGDLVADLPPERQEGSSMSWLTRNQDGELLAAGIYIYRVQRPGQEDYYGKFVIIR